MPVVFENNEIFESIKLFIEDLFIILIQNMCIVFNKQAKYYKTIKWLTISINIKPTAKSYYLRAMAYDNLQSTNFNVIMKRTDLKSAYELNPQDKNIHKMLLGT